MMRHLLQSIVVLLILTATKADIVHYDAKEEEDHQSAESWNTAVKSLPSQKLRGSEEEKGRTARNSQVYRDLKGTLNMMGREEIEKLRPKVSSISRKNGEVTSLSGRVIKKPTIIDAIVPEAGRTTTSAKKRVVDEKMEEEDKETFAVPVPQKKIFSKKRVKNEAAAEEEETKPAVVLSKRLSKKKQVVEAQEDEVDEVEKPKVISKRSPRPVRVEDSAEEETVKKEEEETKPAVVLSKRLSKKKQVVETQEDEVDEVDEVEKPKVISKRSPRPVRVEESAEEETVQNVVRKRTKAPQTVREVATPVENVKSPVNSFKRLPKTPELETAEKPEPEAEPEKKLRIPLPKNSTENVMLNVGNKKYLRSQPTKLHTKKPNILTEEKIQEMAAKVESQKVKPIKTVNAESKSDQSESVTNVAMSFIRNIWDKATGKQSTKNAQKILTEEEMDTMAKNEEESRVKGAPVVARPVKAGPVKPVAAAGRSLPNRIVKPVEVLDKESSGSHFARSGVTSKSVDPSSRSVHKVPQQIEEGAAKEEVKE